MNYCSSPALDTHAVYIKEVFTAKFVYLSLTILLLEIHDDYY